MIITVKLGGPLREKVPDHVGGELSLRLKQGAWVSEAVLSLGLEAEDVAVLLLNGQSLMVDKVLTTGDRLSIFPKCQAFSTISVFNYSSPAGALILSEKHKTIK